MKKFLVEMSARHVHVTEADLETLFGKGAKLTPKKDLSQPGQFACEEPTKSQRRQKGAHIAPEGGL